MFFRLLTVIVLFSLGQLAAQDAANVLVVINDSSPLSRNIGEYYARRRGIPLKNICRIHSTQQEEIARADFERTIQEPIAACLRRNQLVDQVLYIVTTGGVPLRISGSDGLGGDIAAVDSELALLYTDLVSGKPHRTGGYIANPFFGKREAKFTHAEFPIYLVTRLAAYSFNTVQRMIDRSLAARNQGNFVIDMRSGSEETGNNWLLWASQRLPEKRVVLDKGIRVVSDQQDVIAYASWGSNDHARRQRLLNFRWLPGAIATEFVSTDSRTFTRPPKEWNISNDWKSDKAWFAGSPQSLTADYLEEGATAATGHVAEPYLHATPRPDFLFPAYYSGRNLAESYYLSIPYLSWQNILVGDPLCSLRSPGR
jgi:uncharacterized protein (TIGR03790 family)